MGDSRDGVTATGSPRRLAQTGGGLEAKNTQFALHAPSRAIGISAANRLVLCSPPRGVSAPVVCNPPRPWLLSPSPYIHRRLHRRRHRHRHTLAGDATRRAAWRWRRRQPIRQRPAFFTDEGEFPPLTRASTAAARTEVHKHGGAVGENGFASLFWPDPARAERPVDERQSHTARKPQVQ
jgi:hypothetical protein